MSILIQNGAVVNADGRIAADVLVRDGRIEQIGQNLPAGDTVIDATGCYVLPGFIDPHTHLELSPHLFLQDTKAALLGGTTAALEFANQERGDTMERALAAWKAKAVGASCHYGFHMSLSQWTEALERELPAIAKEGVSSFKMYMVYDGLKVDDGEIYGALRALAPMDMLLGVHCENWEILLRMTRETLASGVTGAAGHPLSRPAPVEAEAIARYLRIAELANAPAYIVHLSTAEGLNEIRRARARGQEVYAETCMQYLLLDDARYDDPDGVKYIMSPPLRKRADADALWEAVRNGEIDTVGTDHCSFSTAEKLMHKDDFSQVPNGCASIQHRGQLLYTYGVQGGYIPMERMVALLSTNVAALFGMEGRGALREGNFADIVVWDPAAKSVVTDKNHSMDCDASIYAGFAVEGAARDVLLNGVPAVRQGALCHEGAGQYLPCKKSARYRRA